MMEDFRNIADETFPSFLGHSLNSSANVTFENVTISSNPGLPVAASTVVRSKVGGDNRLSDVCESYLEGKHSPLSGSSRGRQSDSEPAGRFALSFRDDMEASAQAKEPESSSVTLKESHLIHGKQDQNVTEHSSNGEDTLLELLPREQLEDLPTGVHFLQDNKNNKAVPSVPSEKLMEGEISSDHLSSSLSSFLENEKLSSLASSEENSTDDDIDDEEFLDNQLEAYFEQLIQPEITGGDTNIQKLSACCAALKLSENCLFQERFQLPDTCQAVTGVDSGNASDEDSQNQGTTGYSLQRETPPRAVQQLNSMTTEDVLNSCTAVELQLDSQYLQHEDSHKGDVSDVLPKQETHSSECQAAASDAESLLTARGFLGHYSTPEVLSANIPQPDTEHEVGLAETYLSPTPEGCENISLATTGKGDLPHSIVYQNEEGKWVTDLAYYTSFDEEQGLNLSEDDKINEEFITGSEAAAMIAQDQEEFEKAHRLVQAEKADSLNASELADTSWKSANNCILQRQSDLDKDASYLRLSLGEFFGQRSEALGCLGGGSDVKRPSFGYYITSPKKRQPVALLRQSDSPGGEIGQETLQLTGVFQARMTEHGNSPSCEGAWHTTEIASEIQKSINTEAATKSKAKDGIQKGRFGEGSSNHSDSVLSISTIASAIANASSSADPSELAAMIIALSNKSKRTCILPGTGRESELSAHQVSSSNVENGAFDMEKYIKKTDDIGHESESESVMKHESSVQNAMPDSFLLGKDKIKGTLAEDLINNHCKQQEIEKGFPDYFNEENNNQNFSSLSGAPNHKDQMVNSVKYLEKLSDLVNSKHLQSVNADRRSTVLNTQASPAGNGVATCGIPLAARNETAQRSPLAYVNDRLPSRCIGEKTETVYQATSAVSEPCNNVVESSAGNAPSLINLKPAKQSSKYVIVTPTKVKPMQVLSSDEKKQMAKIERRNKDSSTVCHGNAKHVTFEQLSPASQRNTEHKPVVPECDLQPLEDEQYSFRPSTEPLIHSSPSDTSGAAVSGSDDCTSYFQESSCKESVLPQSVYSGLSMSRLTYVSASESTLKNTAEICNPETSLSEDTSELSTTIIRASPTPSQEHPNENLKDHACQRNRKALLSIDQKLEENELAGLKTKLDGVLSQELSEEGVPKSKKQLPSVASNVAANAKELDHVKPALPSKCIFQPPSLNVDAQEVWQDQTNRVQRQGLPIYPGLNTYMPFSQNPSNEPYVPIPSFKPHVATSESQAISSVPTLLAGHTLATTPFAQQHLGNIPPTGNAVLSQFHGCSSAGFGLPAGLPCPGISAGHAENPLTVGIPLGLNIGPGPSGTALLCHQQSASWNKNILNMKSCTGQSAGAGRKEWELSKSPGTGHVKVPEELKIPNACCVGIASQAVLNICNPTGRWLQVSIGILSVSINGVKMDPMKYQCLVFKNKTIVGPFSTNDLKILFLPSHSGIFQCILNVSSWPVSADAETIIQAEALASRVVLTAVAENPDLEVETGKRDYLDFGDLTSGSWKALPLKVINKTHAFVPIRLIINASAVAWPCFTFSKEPINPSNEQTLQMDAPSQTAAPSVVNHVIHASYDGQDPEALTVWVIFHAPKKQIPHSDSLCPADEYLARVDVEVDSPGPTSVIKSIPLRARVGTARIHAPKNLQTISLYTSVGSTAKQQLPLKNAGNISVYLKIKVSYQDSCFAVEPEDLFLLPGEEREVTVLFFPKNIMTTESTLKISVLPSGPQYEVVIKGEAVSEEKQLASTGCPEIPPILSNRQYIVWGGVTLGASVQQKLTLRNCSLSETQHLRLLIRGQDQDSFQLQSIFGSEERLTSSWELRIRPKDDTNIYLIFRPTRITCCFAKLEIKHLGPRSRPGLKFTIPLSGYGGTSNIILENVVNMLDNYMVTLERILPGRSKKTTFCVRNTGSRAAYVKALCFANLRTETVMEPQVMTVSPEKFVLREGTHEVITVIWNPMEEEENFHKKTTVVSSLCLFWGDEISRQQYRRSVMRNPHEVKKIIPEDSCLRNTVFDEEFQGEQLVTEVCDFERRSKDIHLFYANMQKITLFVLGNSNFDRDGFQKSPERHLESDRFEISVRHMSSTLDVLPVRGPQSHPLPAKTDEQVQSQSEAQETWAVKPECLTLTCPSISENADPEHVHIINNSIRMLRFELLWPAHCLTITPQHGIIEPESSTLILVSPNPSLATKPSLIPWSGLIYIHCDNGQKFIEVRIQERDVQSVSGVDFPSSRCDTLTQSPTVHVAKPLSVFPPTKVEIKTRAVFFPKTRLGQSSESYLEMENKGDENVKWHLSSFAPPYIKGVDGTGNVYRVAYSAFICSQISGILEAHREEKVPVIFLPRDKGDYSQFWDLECHPVEEPTWKHKLRFQLSGAGTETENEILPAKPPSSTLTKPELPVIPEMRIYSGACAIQAGRREVTRGIYSPEELYTFPPTRVGESWTLKINLRNNSYKTHLLKFVNPGEPFYMKHSKYSLRSHHYINVPVQFRPKAEGQFEGVFVVLSIKYSPVYIRLSGKGIPKQ